MLCSILLFSTVLSKTLKIKLPKISWFFSNKLLTETSDDIKFNANVSSSNKTVLRRIFLSLLFNMSIDKDSNGCLQDIHWFAGLFGYFPTYTLGALASAQFAETIRKEIPKLDQNIEDGNFKALITWLKRNIHQKGSFFTTNEILEQVTKSSLNAKYFKEYISNRYL